MFITIRESSWIARFAAKKLRAARVAIVIGRRIYLFNTSREEFLQNKRWVCHELVHVEQYARYGKLGFISRYLWESFRRGYHQNRFEVEARQKENDFSILQRHLVK